MALAAIITTILFVGAILALWTGFFLFVYGLNVLVGTLIGTDPNSPYYRSNKQAKRYIGTILKVTGVIWIVYAIAAVYFVYPR